MSEKAMPTTFEGVRTSPNLTLSLNRALEHARDLHQREVTIEHLLLALTDDPDATGSLEACGVDLARLKTDIATAVDKSAGNQTDGPTAEPTPSADLRSLLDQSVEAAREAKRADINSFIVLAAIVGQEKSESATLLQAHGFTFNEAIEALKPRLARTDDGGDTKGQTAGPTARAPSRVGPSAPPALAPPAAQPAPPPPPSAANMEVALAQSAESLPPLPVARAVRRQPAHTPQQQSPQQQPLQARPPLAKYTPRPQSPSADQQPSALSPGATPTASGTTPGPTVSVKPPRGQIQSVDDMMASVRDKMGPARAPAAPVVRAPGAPSALAPNSPPKSPVNFPGAAPQQEAPAMPPAAQAPRPSPDPGTTRPAAAPHAQMPAQPATLRPPSPPGSLGAPGTYHPPADIYDLGTPLPEDRIAKPQRAGRAMDGGDPSAAAPQRREPTLSASPSGNPPITNPQSGPPQRPTRGREPMLAPVPAPVPLPTPQTSPASTLPPQMPQQSARPMAGPHPAAPAMAQRRPGLDAVNPGQLAEAIPRTMRLWVPEKIEVRIARRSLEGLAAGLEGRGPAARHDIVITSAMSVRLKAPDGGFAIDSVSPDTQWIENRPGLLSSDEFASWRWTVQPLRKGRGRLHLIVSARTAGADGSTAETALPDQVIEIKVRTNWGMAVRRWTGWVTAAVIGGALAKFGEGGFELLRKLSGL